MHFGENAMIKLINSREFGQNIQKIRLSRGLTQEQTVAGLQLLGSPISRSTYSLIETGKGNVFVSDLVGLKKLFNVDYDEFFKGIPTSR